LKKLLEKIEELQLNDGFRNRKRVIFRLKEKYILDVGEEIVEICRTNRKPLRGCIKNP